jgi:cytosine/adenosine deaminase-related metal-dependent hydrolase
MPEQATILTAAWIAPMTGPLLRDAGVVFRGGRIAGIGEIRAICRQHPDAIQHDLGNAVVLPGLINAHVHLELSALHPGERPSRFVDWLINLMRDADPATAPAAMAEGIAQCIRFGVTAVGDITAQPVVTRPLLAASPLRGISFGEVRAMAQRRAMLQARLNAAIAPIGSNNISHGISPHAPYSIEAYGYAACLAAANEYQVLLATHLAESPDEAEFLRDHTGPFKALWDLLNAWDNDVPRFDGGPIRFAKSIGLLDHPTLLAHVNYCDDAELDLLASGSAGVVYCPRTHLFFGHPPHRWREMLARGINVAVATDSCASSPDLNLVDDLRLLHKIAPEIPAEHLWKLITTNAARMLAMPDAGALATGRVADAVVFPVQTSDPLLEILESNVTPNHVWVNGVKIKGRVPFVSSQPSME